MFYELYSVVLNLVRLMCVQGIIQFLIVYRKEYKFSKIVILSMK